MRAPPLPLADLTEKQFEQQLIGTRSQPGIARVLGWKAYHTLRSKGSEPGFPDWTLARDRIVFLELKREKGVVSDAQREWIAAISAAGAEAYVVRPKDLDDITQILRQRHQPAMHHQLFKP